MKSAEFIIEACDSLLELDNNSSVEVTLEALENTEIKLAGILKKHESNKGDKTYKHLENSLIGIRESIKSLKKAAGR